MKLLINMQNIRYLCILFSIIPYVRRTMQLYWLSDNIGVSDQISPEDVLELSGLGVRSIICNRPDMESEPDQPDANSIMQASQKLGIKFAFHPVDSNFQTEKDASEMAKYLCKLPKPIIAYCRSGGRSTALIGLAGQLQFINLQELE